MRTVSQSDPALSTPQHLWERHKKHRKFGGRLWTPRQLHEVTPTLGASYLTTCDLVVSAAKIQTAWFTTPPVDVFSRLQSSKLQPACSQGQAPSGASSKPLPGPTTAKQWLVHHLPPVNYCHLPMSPWGASWGCCPGDALLRFTRLPAWPFQDN